MKTLPQNTCLKPEHEFETLGRNNQAFTITKIFFKANFAIFSLIPAPWCLPHTPQVLWGFNFRLPVWRKINTGSTKREFKGCGAPVFRPRNNFRAKLLLWARQSRFEPKWGQNGLDLPILARSNISEQGSGGSRFPESALSASLSLYSQSGRQNILHLHRLSTFWQWLLLWERADLLGNFLSSHQCNAERSHEPYKMCFVQHAS